ncbi:MAG TPA: hydantoinase/oxoprolinase family protein [Nitrososphaerales archaeon]|nr:hydantoinase/oxoprolinase family protein [Nitrososphaerales archaeon]
MASAASDSYSIGIDVGGTFTDLVLSSEATGETAIEKVLTTPANPAEGIIDGMNRLLESRKVEYSQLSQVIHGTTIGSNTVIERTGAKVGFVTSNGHRDVLQMGREWRYDIYDLGIRFNTPLVPRRLCMEVEERILHDGKIYNSLDTRQLLRTVRELVGREKVEALAISFLHAYANPIHERKAKELIEKQYPRLFVSISSEVLPTIREYERASTTVTNAYIGPIVARYLTHLEDKLKKRGFRGRVFLTTSAGALMTTDLARRFPVRLLESGPAAGVVISQFIGERIRQDDLLSFDMGGTTSKGSFIIEGKPFKVDELEVARVHRYKPGSGIPLKVPSIGMVEIGVGGGSIAQLDERGVIAIGPRSAGASPGPACYGLGGEDPTVTDADLVLGYLNPEYFLGGRMKLDVRKASDTLDNVVAKRLHSTTLDSALAIYETANQMIASSFRLHAAERGIDYTKASIIVYGGAGPIHATGVAKSLGVRSIVFPIHAGVLSAYGLLVSQVSFDITQTKIASLADLGSKEYVETFERLIRETGGILKRTGIQELNRIERKLDMRYAGQGYEIELDLGELRPDAKEFNDLPRRFQSKYAQLYSEKLSAGEPEIVNFRISVFSARRKVRVGFGGSGEAKSVGARETKSRRAYFEEGYKDCTVIDRYSLRPGDRISGPAIVEEFETTTILDEGQIGEVDKMYNIVVKLTA